MPKKTILSIVAGLIATLGAFITFNREKLFPKNITIKEHFDSIDETRRERKVKHQYLMMNHRTQLFDDIIDGMGPPRKRKKVEKRVESYYINVPDWIEAYNALRALHKMTGNVGPEFLSTEYKCIFPFAAPELSYEESKNADIIDLNIIRPNKNNSLTALKVVDNSQEIMGWVFACSTSK